MAMVSTMSGRRRIPACCLLPFACFAESSQCRTMEMTAPGSPLTWTDVESQITDAKLLLADLNSSTSNRALLEPRDARACSGCVPIIELKRRPAPRNHLGASSHGFSLLAISFAV